jgi:ubiquinone/menaquinone biosynthesis C-methylase UbiE
MAGGEGPVGAFYDRHPINEEQILGALRERGIVSGAIPPEALQELDQDHYGGIEALDTLAHRAGIAEHHYVVDLCSGVGGPARYLARTRGCRVLGVDLTASRHRAAVRLTQMAQLSHRVSFCHADVRDVPFPDASFDVAVSQEAFAHVPDKPRLVAELARLVRPGGTIAFTDIVRRVPLEPAVAERLAAEMTFTEIESSLGYVRLLEAQGCAVVSEEDLSAGWTELLQRRLEMYRGLRASTVKKLGEAAYERYDAAYAHFVSLYAYGVLGGVRLVARRGRA